MIVLGVMIVLLGRLGLPRLPGDILIERENYKIYIPITSAIIISVALSFIAYLAGRYLG